MTPASVEGEDEWMERGAIASKRQLGEERGQGISLPCIAERFSSRKVAQFGGRRLRRYHVPKKRKRTFLEQYAAGSSVYQRTGWHMYEEVSASQPTGLSR